MGDQELEIPPELLGRGSKERTARALDQSNKMFIVYVVKYLYCVFIGIF